MSGEEKIVAGRLLNMASETYANLGCNDMPVEHFEGISVKSREAMAEDFNEWNGTRGDDAIPFTHIQDWAWMAYLAEKLCGGGDA